MNTLDFKKYLKDVVEQKPTDKMDIIKYINQELLAYVSFNNYINITLKYNIHIYTRSRSILEKCKIPKMQEKDVRKYFKYLIIKKVILPYCLECIRKVLCYKEIVFKKKNKKEYIDYNATISKYLKYVLIKDFPKSYFTTEDINYIVGIFMHDSSANLDSLKSNLVTEIDNTKL